MISIFYYFSASSLLIVCLSRGSLDFCSQHMKRETLYHRRLFHHHNFSHFSNSRERERRSESKLMHIFVCWNLIKEMWDLLDWERWRLLRNMADVYSKSSSLAWTSTHRYVGIWFGSHSAYLKHFSKLRMKTFFKYLQDTKKALRPWIFKTR